MRRTGQRGWRNAERAHVSARRSAASPAGIARAGAAVCAALAAALGSTGPAWCQGMNDPTRPPQGIGAGEPYQGAPDGGPVLQSVLISPAGSYAIISGEMVKVGQKFGDAVLVKVAESEAVLRNDSGTQVLKLHPGVDKRASTPQPGKASRSRAGSTRPRQGER